MEKCPKACQKYCGLQFYKTKISLVFFVFIYTIINILLVIQRYFQFKDRNLSFKVLLVLKRCLNWLGTIEIFRIVLPISDFQAYHKFIGSFILILSIIHTIIRLNDKLRLIQNTRISKFS
jgi:hypothetical protein